MNANWYPGISVFCAYWPQSQMLQQTLATLESEFDAGNDACIDAAKAIVECACRIIIEALDDPAAPIKPAETDTPITQLVGLATRVLKLGDSRDKAFGRLISEHNRMTDALRVLRNEAGTLSHGKDGFIAKLSMHHQRSAILAADAIVTFLHEAYVENEPDPNNSFEPYERFQNANYMIDSFASCSNAIVDDGYLRVVISVPGQDDLQYTVETSRLLFGTDRQAYKVVLNACKEAMKTENDNFLNSLPMEGEDA